jgi:hypothetical protein
LEFPDHFSLKYWLCCSLEKWFISMQIIDRVRACRLIT